MVTWNRVSRAAVLRAMRDYDRPGPERFFSKYGFAPTTSYELACEKRRYPPKAIFGTAYDFAMGQRLGSSDFEGGKTGAVRCSNSGDSQSRGSDERPSEAAWS